MTNEELWDNISAGMEVDVKIHVSPQVIAASAVVSTLTFLGLAMATFALKSTAKKLREAESKKEAKS